MFLLIHILFFQASEIVVDSLDNTENLTSNWQFMLLEFASSHYVAICTEKDVNTKGKKSSFLPMKLRMSIKKSSKHVL